MEYISYTASLIATILGLIEPFGKKMRTILVLNFCGNFLVGISYLIISRYSGAAICAIGCAQVLINYNFVAKNKKLPIWLVALYCLAFLTVNIITFTYWYDVLALVAAIMFVVGLAQSNAKYYRVCYMSNALLWIIYDILAQAYGNLFTHTTLFVATSIAIYVRDITKKRSENSLPS